MASSDKTTCVLCETGESGIYDFERGRFWFDCLRCGRFHITEEAMDVIRRLPSRPRWSLGGVTREKSDHASTGITIMRADIPALLSQAPEVFDIPTKVRRLLSAIARRSTFAGDWITLDSSTDLTLAYSTTAKEFSFLCRYATEAGWLDGGSVAAAVESSLLNPPYKTSFRLLPSGWEETQRRPRTESDKAFVAMWFADEVHDAYVNGIAKAITDDCGYRSVRIDTEHYNGDIVDQVLAEINESRFVVADLTGHRNGVYFEAGYAMGQRIEVIWTCRDNATTGTHFDAEHFNQIRWKDPTDLREKLQNRIRATVGRGPLLSRA